MACVASIKKEDWVALLGFCCVIYSNYITIALHFITLQFHNKTIPLGNYWGKYISLRYPPNIRYKVNVSFALNPAPYSHKCHNIMCSQVHINTMYTILPSVKICVYYYHRWSLMIRKMTKMSPELLIRCRLGAEGTYSVISSYSIW